MYTGLRDWLSLLALAIALQAFGLFIWAIAPKRRLLRSAVVAGLVAGRVAAGVAW